MRVQGMFLRIFISIFFTAGLSFVALIGFPPPLYANDQFPKDTNQAGTEICAETVHEERISIESGDLNIEHGSTSSSDETNVLKSSENANEPTNDISEQESSLSREIGSIDVEVPSEPQTSSLSLNQEAISSQCSLEGIDPHGRVTDLATGNPLEGVLIQALQNGAIVASDTSDIDGVYDFLIPEGAYEIYASRTGYISQIKPIEVINGTDLVVDFVLIAGDPTFYVSTTGSDTYPYDSWEKAANSIQSAINAANPGDTVQVAAGIYNENITLKSGVVVQGAGASTTIIQGTGSGPVVTAINVDSNAKIDRFTITGGNATDGGGILCSNSSPTISNNTIADNVATNVGAGIAGWDSNPTISNNVITGNIAFSGGGVFLYRSSSVISNNIIFNNTAVYGGGINLSSCSLTMTVFNNVISDNVSTRGTGIFCYLSSPTIFNNIISGNSASYDYGGGILCYGASPTIFNNTIVNNSAVSGGGGIYCVYYSLPVIFNCIFWGNTDDLYGCSANYSCIEDNDPGIGNTDQDPMFVNASVGDYHLSASSPCVDAGTNNNAPGTDFEGDTRPFDGNRDGFMVVDMGADEYINTAPAVSVLQPNGGEVWIGENNILWSANDIDGDTLLIDIYYSSDGASSWYPVVIGESNDGLFYWDTTIVSDGLVYLIRVIASDGIDLAQDESDSAFVIDNVTPYYTAQGSNIELFFYNGCRVVFEEVTFPGETDVLDTNYNLWGSAPSSFKFLDCFYDIITTAEYAGIIEVTIPYNENDIEGSEEDLRLFHWNGSNWEDVTVLVDTVNNTITGQTGLLSPFVVTQRVMQIKEDYVSGATKPSELKDEELRGTTPGPSSPVNELPFTGDRLIVLVFLATGLLSAGVLLKC